MKKLINWIKSRQAKKKALIQLEVLNQIYIAGEELETFDNLLLKIRELCKKTLC